MIALSRGHWLTRTSPLMTYSLLADAFSKKRFYYFSLYCNKNTLYLTFEAWALFDYEVEDLHLFNAIGLAYLFIASLAYFILSHLSSFRYKRYHEIYHFSGCFHTYASPQFHWRCIPLPGTTFSSYMLPVYFIMAKLLLFMLTSSFIFCFDSDSAHFIVLIKALSILPASPSEITILFWFLIFSHFNTASRWYTRHQ